MIEHNPNYWEDRLAQEAKDEEFESGCSCERCYKIEGFREGRRDMLEAVLTYMRALEDGSGHYMSHWEDARKAFEAWAREMAK